MTESPRDQRYRELAVQNILANMTEEDLPAPVEDAPSTPMQDDQHATSNNTPSGTPEEAQPTSVQHSPVNNIKEKRVTLKIEDLCQRELVIKIKPNTPLRRPMAYFCQQYHLDPRKVRFLFDGVRLLPGETPATMGPMSDDLEQDKYEFQIGVYWEQLSGGAVCH